MRTPTSESVFYRTRVRIKTRFLNNKLRAEKAERKIDNHE